MEIRALNAEKQRDDALDKAAVFRHQFYEAASRLEEEQGKNLKLRAQINRDYENSSIPSSKAVRRKRSQTTGKNRQKTRRAARPQRALPEKAGAYTASYSSSST